jgi:hypothetical protein
LCNRLYDVEIRKVICSTDEVICSTDEIVNPLPWLRLVGALDPCSSAFAGAA